MVNNVIIFGIWYTNNGSQNKYKLSPKKGKEAILTTILTCIFLVLFWLML